MLQLQLLQLLLHEIIHALCYPISAEVKIFQDIKNGVIVCFCGEPIRKSRFIVMSLAPSVCLAIIPFVIWCIMIHNFDGVGQYVFSYCILVTILGGGDFINAFNAAVQMPQNSFHQLSGIHSYWFEKAEDNKL